MATLVARMAETLCHEFGRQVVVLFLRLPLSSCVVNEKLVQVTPACITLTDNT